MQVFNVRQLPLRKVLVEECRVTEQMGEVADVCHVPVPDRTVLELASSDFGEFKAFLDGVSDFRFAFRFERGR